MMAFIFTPLMVSLGYLQLLRWPYINVFLMISFIGFLAKAATSLIISLEDQYQAKQHNSHISARLQPAMKPLDEHIGRKDDKGDNS